MAVKLNDAGFSHAKRLIRDGKVDLESDWSDEQPSAKEENRFIEQKEWKAYSQWFLAVDTGEDTDNKAHYKFPYGDFKKVHRKGVIAAKQRAAQNDYHDVEKAADELLGLIDRRSGEDRREPERSHKAR